MKPLLAFAAAFFASLANRGTARAWISVSSDGRESRVQCSCGLQRDYLEISGRAGAVAEREIRKHIEATHRYEAILRIQEAA